MFTLFLLLRMSRSDLPGTALNENKWCIAGVSRKSGWCPHGYNDQRVCIHIYIDSHIFVRMYVCICVTGLRVTPKERYDHRSLGVISGAFRLSFAFIRRTNYSSCHGCSFVDGVFIPMRKSPITSRENCLSLQQRARNASNEVETMHRVPHPRTATESLLLLLDVSITAEHNGPSI